LIRKTCPIERRPDAGGLAVDGVRGATVVADEGADRSDDEELDDEARGDDEHAANATAHSATETADLTALVPRFCRRSDHR